MSISKQQENIKHLLQIVKENPELEILPMVQNEVYGGDDYTWWLGNWGKATIDEYWDKEEVVYFKSESYQQLIIDYADEISEELNLNSEQKGKKAKEYVDNLDWIKAIVVKIVI